MKSFKQFLALEDARDIRAKQYTREEIKKLPAPDPRNIETVCQIDDLVVLDEINGLGACPNNQNVIYRGFAAFMSPDMFLKLAGQYDKRREESAVEIRKLIEDGYSIGCPMFYINVYDFIDGKKNARIDIDGHEGRGRCLAMRTLGIKEIPVQFILMGEARARHIDKDMIKLFSERMYKEQEETVHVKNPFTRVFFDGKEFTI